MSFQFSMRRIKPAMKLLIGSTSFVQW